MVGGRVGRTWLIEPLAGISSGYDGLSLSHSGRSFVSLGLCRGDRGLFLANATVDSLTGESLPDRRVILPAAQAATTGV